jgi:hypothetical protein
MFNRVRAVLTRPESSRFAVLALLDEYTSQLFVKFLGNLRQDLSRIAPPPAVESSLDYHASRRQLDQFFDQLQEREAQHRRRFSASGIDEESDLERERRLVRLSHLKKFFQSHTFIEVSREQAAKRISESTAAIGTASAGIIAAMVEQFSRPEIKNFATQSLIVVSFGVLIYVLRDRMKDWAKGLLLKKASKFLPDFELQLMAKERRIGNVKEWFRFTSAKDLPSDVFKLRQVAAASAMERKLPEDIFHCHKIQEVDGTALQASKPLPTHRALHENTRINLERYLKHMDDPFKDLTDLDASGRFTRSRSHRVYHFYLCVKTASRPKDGIEKMRARFSPLRLLARQAHSTPSTTVTAETQIQIYRIVLDKTGVVRLEDLQPRAH